MSHKLGLNMAKHEEVRDDVDNTLEPQANHEEVGDVVGNTLEPHDDRRRACQSTYGHMLNQANNEELVEEGTEILEPEVEEEEQLRR